MPRFLADLRGPESLALFSVCWFLAQFYRTLENSPVPFFFPGSQIQIYPLRACSSSLRACPATRERGTAAVPSFARDPRRCTSRRWRDVPVPRICPPGARAKAGLLFCDRPLANI
jgi:hypothetical protein